MRIEPGPDGPRRIVITGASSGLGAGLARDYAAPGVALLLLARRGDLLEQVAAACRARGAIVAIATLDVGEAEPLGTLLRATDDAAPIDLVIANAGIARPPGEAGAAAQVRTNLLGAMHAIEPLIPRMVVRGYGRIAVVASVAGLRGLPDCPAYCASKAGLRVYGEALRARLGPLGIAVCVITPGFFASPMAQRFRGRRLLMASGEHAVRLVRRGIDRRQARVGFPRALVVLLRLLDLLAPRLGDAAVRLFRFHIEEAAQSCDRNASIRAK